MAQQAQAQIGLAAVGVDNLAVRVLGQGVNRQVAAEQILFEGDVGCGVAGEAGVAGA